MFGTVLIANRGEIAVRIARTCRDLGIRTVAVYSTADQDAAVLRMVDEAVCIGPPQAKHSYLNSIAILQAAARTGADAIHPGYGLLSEDADFADACESTGVTLVGPASDVMAKLGDKASARSLMSEAGLPLLPGSLDPLDCPKAHELADKIGYPVIVKATAGGGGRGMSVVRNSCDFVDTFRRTQATARMLFGDGRVYVERYLDTGRHVEVQVLGDRHGHLIHLGCRDCSVQRRHQKLIEESPAPELPDGLADEMGAAAVRAARTAGYTGAGTFEFLVDREGHYYFLEVNCRIQVEHPVTELVTGVDLVAEQLRVAAGYQLALRQEDVAPRGVAVECRVNAEDPARDFAPTPGRINRYTPPGGPYVRVDSHMYAGATVPPNYDSLLAKVITWAPQRDLAIARMRRALTEFEVSGPGIATTIDFLLRVLDEQKFRKAEHDTSLVDTLISESRRDRSSGTR
jgi:acetyl-CoA carboxylase biotin carboxylase subunit